tara:strand:+ start:466 stop:624 length:159 start_codon:yes stop_codon:yes gene_type:complete
MPEKLNLFVIIKYPANINVKYDILEPMFAEITSNAIDGIFNSTRKINVYEAS